VSHSTTGPAGLDALLSTQLRLTPVLSHEGGRLGNLPDTTAPDDSRARRPTIDAHSLTQARADAVTVLG